VLGMQHARGRWKSPYKIGFKRSKKVQDTWNGQVVCVDGRMVLKAIQIGGYGTGYKNEVHTSQETHHVSATESSRLMPCKI
jgi:hypothetical protein